jgi:predicted RNase H-like HicB family nuclease
MSRTATTIYGLYLESGPKRRKTMVHVLELLGCVATGPTTDETLAATPEAIRAYLRFLRRHGEPVDPGTPFTTEVVEHITAGSWLGNGSPYLTFRPDLEPVTEDEIESVVRRFGWLREELASWAEMRTAEQLDAQPDGGGRTAHAILLHVIGPNYIAGPLGGVPGYSALHGAAERGELALPDALRRGTELTAKHLRAATPEQRAAVQIHPAQGPRTLHRAVRRTLEHDWEHLAELSRRPGGPEL